MLDSVMGSSSPRTSLISARTLLCTAGWLTTSASAHSMDQSVVSMAATLMFSTISRSPPSARRSSPPQGYGRSRTGACSCLPECCARPAADGTRARTAPTSPRGTCGSGRSRPAASCRTPARPPAPAAPSRRPRSRPSRPPQCRQTQPPAAAR
uniref:Uncharacterized protein n=1 Tax=Oryza rufipogon TaxID=4529 RepID=A0A0E0NEM9_ORYRU